jgi:hypothetical protein
MIKCNQESTAAPLAEDLREFAAMGLMPLRSFHHGFAILTTLNQIGSKPIAQPIRGYCLLLESSR